MTDWVRFFDSRFIFISCFRLNFFSPFFGAPTIWVLCRPTGERLHVCAKGIVELEILGCATFDTLDVSWSLRAGFPCHSILLDENNKFQWDAIENSFRLSPASCPDNIVVFFCLNFSFYVQFWMNKQWGTPVLNNRFLAFDCIWWRYFLQPQKWRNHELQQSRLKN